MPPSVQAAYRRTVDGPPSDTPRWMPAPREPSRIGLGADGPVVRAFLIADIRGYTRFTAEQGDEAAAMLAARFAEVTGTVVAGYGGQLLELRGDEALVVFTSARSAARAALALRERCITETLEHPTTPLPVGIGLDVGEAVPLAQGYRGAALNVAARLCAKAKAGEVLTTSELAHLAGAIPGGVFSRGAEVSLKGVPDPVRVFELAPADEDLEQVRRFARLVASPGRRMRRRTVAMVAGLAVIVALLAGALLIVETGGGPGVPASTESALGVIDPGRGRIADVVPFSGNPTAITATNDAIWVASESDGTVQQVDPARRLVVDTIPVGPGPSALVTDGRSVWVAISGAGAVVQLNTSSRTVVATVPVGDAPSAIAAGFGKLWVANLTDATVTRIDPATLTTRTIRVGDAPDAVAVGDGAVWVANRADDTVVPINPATLSVGSPIPVGAGPAALAVTAEGVWVSDSLDRTVTRIDPRTGQQVRFVVGDIPGALTPVGHTVWVSVQGNARVVGIDARTNRLRAIVTGSAPVASLAVAGRLWIAQQAFASAAHRGGTLVVKDVVSALTGAPSADVDPQEMYSNYPLLLLAYDGLVRLAPAPGPAGNEIVPDLATALPRPSADGLTYTFTLRRSIRYSDGRVVRASDVVRGLRRVFTSGGYQQYAPRALIPAVVGTPACRAHPQQCVLGVAADDAAGTITFRLSHPDPDFLAELTLPYDTPVPPGTPERHVLDRPIAATGPYQFGPVTRDTSTKPPTVTTVTLVRNPYFHVWSTAAQPPGYPDQIRFEAASTNASAVAAVRDGRADLTALSADLFGTIPQLRRSYPDRFHVTQMPSVQYALVNLNRPPFDKPMTRRALSMALDRTASYGVGGPWQPTCRMVPSGFPGSSRDCPPHYIPRGDVTRARALLKGVPRYGGTVTVIVYDAPQWVRFGQAYAAAARALGYHTVLRRLTDNYVEQIFDPNATWNIGAFYWAADYPTPSNFYLPLLACPQPEPPSNPPHKASSFGLQCNPRTDAEAAAALHEQLRDPGKGVRDWTRLYLMLDQQVVLLPTHRQVGMYLASKRLGNFQSQFIYGPLYDQMWVR